MQTLNVTLVGAGHYARDLIGPHYAREAFDHARLTAVVDPKVSKDDLDSSPLKRYPLYQTSADIFSAKLGRNAFEAVDMALAPACVPGAVREYAKYGIKNMVLPKPVATTPRALAVLQAESREHHLKLGVASNWAYSKLPGLVEDVVRETKAKGYSITKIDVHYDKERSGGMQDNSPVNLCFPHCLQFLDSSHLLDMKTVAPKVVEATPTKVLVHYSPPDIKDGVDVQSDMNAPFDRSVRIYLNDQDPAPDIVANLGTQFEPDGQTLAKGKGASLVADIGKGENRIRQNTDASENTLEQAYASLFSAFSRHTHAAKNLPVVGSLVELWDWLAFNRDKSVLTLKRYVPIQKQLLQIQRQWEQKSGIPA